ncbi:MAG: TonB-dependent receptor [Candidatus Marinimicrobia bacterium]|nr:TonB-dependent receptor [Candidatus Neomarinimicrobiota bacterium]
MKRLIIHLILISSLFGNTIINGTVFHEQTKEPIVGANIIVIGSDQGSFSDKRGYFKIELGQTFPIEINVSHIGFETITFTIENDFPVTINLIPAVITSQSVEVVGERKKYESDVSSSIDIVDLEDIELQGARDLGSSLRRVSSIKIDYSTSGKQTISIRGNNATDVAVFLDGIKMNDSNTGVADLSSLDLNVIEQIQVIKGGNSTLYGSGAIGGVVNMESKRAEKNGLYVNQGIGQTFNDDVDFSVGATGRWKAFGVGGRYSGKTRAYGGRTITTSIFQNVFSNLDLNSGNVNVRYYQFNKGLEFPSGGVATQDDMTLFSAQYDGRLFKWDGWSFQAGQRYWALSQDFFTSLDENLQDESLNVQALKHGRIGKLDISLQYELEDQKFLGVKNYKSLFGDTTVIQRGDMKRRSQAGSSVFQWEVLGDHPYVDIIAFELAMRLNYIQTIREQSFDFPGIPGNNGDISYDKPGSFLASTPSSKKIGIRMEGKTPRLDYSFFVNQGNNTRLPSLSDFFRFSNAREEDKVDSTLVNENVSTTEGNLLFNFKLFENSKILDGMDITFGYFRNHYTNKIAYRLLDDSPPVPYNTLTSEISGQEFTINSSNLKGKLNLSFATTLLHISDVEIFPNKPERRSVTTIEWNQDWFVATYDMTYDGEQFFFIPGVGGGVIKPKENANLSLSLRKKYFGLNWRASYTIRNIYSKDEIDLTLEESLERGYNYFDKYREILTIKVEW